MCLLALAVTIKPLADAMAKYTCCDGHKDACEDFQSRHLLSVARLEKGSGFNIPTALDSVKAVAVPGNKKSPPWREPKEGKKKGKGSHTHTDYASMGLRSRYHGSIILKFQQALISSQRAAGIAKAPRNLGAFAATWARSHALAFAFYKFILP